MSIDEKLNIYKFCEKKGAYSACKAAMPLFFCKNKDVAESFRLLDIVNPNNFATCTENRSFQTESR